MNIAKELKIANFVYLNNKLLKENELLDSFLYLEVNRNSYRFVDDVAWNIFESTVFYEIKKELEND